MNNTGLQDILSFRKIAGLISNFSIRITGNTISKVLSFVTVPIISRSLGPETYGNYNLIIVILSYTAILINWGFRPIGIRETASGQGTKTVRDFLSTRLLLSFFSILISTLTTTIIYFTETTILISIFIGFIFVLAQTVNIDFFYFGKGNMLVPTASQIFGQLIYVAGVVIFINNPGDLWKLVGLYGTYNMVTSMAMICIYLRKEKIPIRLSLKNTFLILGSTFRVGLASKVELLQSTFPILIVSAFLGSYLLGIFSASLRFFTFLLLIFQTANLVLAPYVVKISGSPGLKKILFSRVLTVSVLLFGVACSLFFYFTADLLVPLIFGNEFLQSIEVFRHFCLYLIPFTPLSMILNAMLIYSNNDNYYLISTGIAAVLIVICSLALTHLIGLHGTVLAMAISNFGNIISSMIFNEKICPGLFTGFINKTRVRVDIDR